MKLGFTVNGERRDVDVPPIRRLLDVLREELRLTGTKEGCGEGECGACTVLLDGRPVKSCTVLAVQADGRDVMTVEGLAGPSELHPIQEGFKDEHGLQCGFCTPGMIAITREFLQHNPTPTREEATEAVSGALCRCTGYEAIVDAILLAAELIANTPIRTEEAADE